mgnify:CR=1 FL=1|tara:strand:+ start:1219 stop:1902 length:684 start_codon:yes stop_codon:yes gene_type:complete
MANITVSSAVDTMLQSANNSAIRSNIGAIAPDFSGSLTGDLEFQDGEILFNEGFSVEGGDIELSSSGQTIILNGNDIGGGGSITASTVTAQGMLSAEADAEFQDSVEFQAGVDFQDGFEVSGGDIDASNANSFEVGDFTVNGTAEFQDTVEISGADLEFTAGGGQSLIMGGGVISGAESIEATSFMKVSPITTSARNALSASNGMIIYNSSTNKFQGRANGAWVDLH